MDFSFTFSSNTQQGKRIFHDKQMDKKNDAIGTAEGGAEVSYTAEKGPQKHARQRWYTPLHYGPRLFLGHLGSLPSHAHGGHLTPRHVATLRAHDGGGGYCGGHLGEREGVAARDARGGG